MSTLGEHRGNGIRFDMHLSAPNGGVAQMLCRPEGQWVSWSEYDKLKAEVERLTERLNRHLEINDELDARCTRLRKVGDAMEREIRTLSPIDDYSSGIIKAWNAAKEGKPSV